MKIATWNVNSLRVRMPRFLPWLVEVQPDIVCLQETKLDDKNFEKECRKDIEKLGYETAHYGKGGYNGVAVLSRVGIKNIQNGFSIEDKDGNQIDDPDARVIWADCGDTRVASSYIPNGRELGHSHYFYKLDWLGWLKKQVEKELKDNKHLVVVGDFNVAPADIDVWDKKVFEGMTHTSPEERKAWKAVVSAGLEDVFRSRYPKMEKLYTYWDYQQLRFPKHQGIRIDHILASKTLAEKLKWIIVDRNARKGEKPSDHAPVVADFG